MQWVKFLSNSKFLISALIALNLIGCAGNKPPADPNDPYENINRHIFKFNKQVDRIVIKPVAEVYTAVLPWQIRSGVNNAFNNIGEIANVVNDLLQFEVTQAFVDTSRFFINTTIGVGGLFEVASHMGLERNYEDFGLTLAKWGVKQSPYLVLPILGPSTVRDAVGLSIDGTVLTLWPYIDPQWIAYTALTVKGIALRSQLLPGDKVLEQTFDPYVFVRDAYMQRRSYLVDNNSHEKVDTFVAASGHQNPHRKAVENSSIIGN